MFRAKVKILLADDHPIMLNGLKKELNDIGYLLIDCVSDGEKALEKLTHNKYDLAILDIEMPKLNGFDIKKTLDLRGTSVPIIFLSYHEEKSYLRAAKKLGVLGYLLKEDGIDVLDKCIQSVLAKRKYYSHKIHDIIQYDLSEELMSLQSLSKSETIIIKNMAKGLNSAQIAQNLNISKRTVEKHRSNIKAKLAEDIRLDSLAKWVVQNALMIENL